MKVKVQYSAVTGVHSIRVFTGLMKSLMTDIVAELQRQSLSEGVNIMTVWDLFLVRTVQSGDFIELITYSSRVTECSIRVTNCSIRVYQSCNVKFEATPGCSSYYSPPYLAGGVAIHLANSIACNSSGILASGLFLLFDDRVGLNGYLPLQWILLSIVASLDKVLKVTNLSSMNSTVNLFCVRSMVITNQIPW